MDHLSPIFDHFSPSAKVFFTGNLCTATQFDASDGLGHLHVLYGGTLEITTVDGPVIVVDEPSLLLYPQPVAHRLKSADEDASANLVCASIDMGSRLNNPLLTALPELLHVKLVDIPRLESTLKLLFDESTCEDSGQRAALDRLTEYLLILLLRHVIETGYVSVGIIEGLRDPKLHKAIKAMHEKPGHRWTLDELADIAAMSRARFAARFKEKTGTTPLNHLTLWRVGVACSMLRKGERIDRISDSVGYNSQSAFTRVFTKHVGLAPMEWLDSYYSDSKKSD